MVYRFRMGMARPAAGTLAVLGCHFCYFGEQYFRDRICAAEDSFGHRVGRCA